MLCDGRKWCFVRKETRQLGEMSRQEEILTGCGGGALGRRKRWSAGAVPRAVGLSKKGAETSWFGLVILMSLMISEGQFQ